MPPTCLMSSPYLNKPSSLQQGYDNNNYKITSPHICMQYQGAHFLFYLDSILRIKFNKNPFHNVNLLNIEKIDTLTSVYFLSKPLMKIGTANPICWNYLGLFRDTSLDHIFFSNKTFLFFKIETDNFRICLKINFMKPHKIPTQLDNRQKKWK